MDTPESFKEMISVATAFAEAGDGNAMGRLGRAYRDGRGVKQDLGKAAEWMRKAADKNIGWAKNELFDILWRINTPESQEEMISVATAFAEAGDGNAMGRLGRAYRDGRGVSQDLEKAAEWMRKAARRNVNLFKDELYEIVWKISTDSSVDCLSHHTDKNVIRKYNPRDAGTIIFNLTHPGCLWQLIALRCNFHAVNNSVLIVGDYAKENTFINSLVTNGVFDSVIYYDCWKFTTLKDESLVIAGINEYFGLLLKEHGIDISIINTIYTGSDLVNSFALFLSLNGINYTTIELSPNQLSNDNRYFWGSKFAAPNSEPLPFFILQKKYGILCQERYNGPVLLSEETSLDESCLCHICYILNFKKALHDISKDYVRRIIECIPDLDKLMSADVLLTPSSLDPSTRYYKKEDYAYIYQVFVDYYLSRYENIVIKTHPSNPHILDGHFQDGMLVGGEYPIQLLELVPNLKFDLVCGVYSDAVRQLDGISKVKMEAGSEFFKLFPHLHKIYAMHLVISAVFGRPSNMVIKYTDNIDFVDSFIDYTLPAVCDLITTDSEIDLPIVVGLERVSCVGSYICVYCSDDAKEDTSTNFHYVLRLSVRRIESLIIKESLSYIHITSPCEIVSLTKFNKRKNLLLSKTEVCISSEE